MFCKSCGRPLGDRDQVSGFCGTPAGAGHGFCPQCGQPVEPDAAFCVHCGARLAGAAQADPAKPPQKSRLVAGLLGIFLGGIGIHNFYLGYNEKGIGQIILFILCCGVPSVVWGFIEGIMILCGQISTDAGGNPLAD